MKKIIISILVSISLLSGCVSVGSNRDKINMEYAYKNIKKNKTTKDEVIALFGHPDDILELKGNKEIWTYNIKEGMSILDVAQEAISASGSSNVKANRAMSIVNKNADKLSDKTVKGMKIMFTGNKATTYKMY